MTDFPPGPAMPVSHAGSILAAIERMIRSDIDPSRIQQVLDLYNQERDRAQLEAFNVALSDLQSEIWEVAASGRNPTFRSAYSTLHDLLKEARPIYTRYGVSIRFGTALRRSAAPPLQQGWIRVVLIISHNQGHWEEHWLDGPPDASRSGRTPVQTVGSTTTYLRRYLFMMILNLVPGGDPTDDDGRGSGSAPITPEQVTEIQTLAREAGISDPEFRDRWLVAANAPTIEEIRASYYPRIINALRHRKERQEEL